MLGLFKRPLLSLEDEQFQTDTYIWLINNLAHRGGYQHGQLVLPTRAFFPAKVECAEDVAEATFAAVKQHMGLDDWPCVLAAQEPDIDPVVAPTVALAGVPHSPAGTFRTHDVPGIDADSNFNSNMAGLPGTPVTITYNPVLLTSPEAMVATFAHELSHYLTATFMDPPPGGWDNWEFATDLTATFLGFGVFMANSAFTFQQFTDMDAQGWHSQQSGYLSEAEHMFAVGLYMTLHGVTLNQVKPYLKRHLYALLKRSLRTINDRQLTLPIRAARV